MLLNELINKISYNFNRVNDMAVVQRCGLAIGTTTTKLKTTIQIDVVMDNTSVSLPPTDNITVTACAQQAVGTFCFYSLVMDRNSNLTVLKGTDNTYALPQTPINTIVIAGFKVITDGGTTFTAGTTALNAAGVTVTYSDVYLGIVLGLINEAIKNIERKKNFHFMEISTNFNLAAGTDRYANTIPNFKEFMDEGVFLSDTTMNYPPLLLRPPTYLRSLPALSDRPQYITTTPIIETTYSPDIQPVQEWLVYPNPDQVYALYMQAYQYSPVLDCIVYSTNWWVENAGDFIMYDVLLNAPMHFLTSTKTKEWAAKRAEKLENILDADRGVSDGNIYFQPARRGIYVGSRNYGLYR